MKTKKIINDPVYGFISVPTGIIFDIIEHPYFQRLKRIKQLGLTHYVYPGAVHSRFSHALGAFHLMTEAISVLKTKGTEVTEAEEEGVYIAILLHDIGHGPFSHALEHGILNLHHEEISLLFMNSLNTEFGGKLDLAISIFKGEYKKKFLHQLVSSQLDMDRMDYLNRDSYFTGVHEGVIGYDRIINMLTVHEGELVVEEKGIYSVEKFLIARKLMYWQAYLHKAALAAELMLIKVLERAKELFHAGVEIELSKNVEYFFSNTSPSEKDIISNFSKLDDIDILYSIKRFTEHPDFTLRFLSQSILNRKLFKMEMKNTPFDSDQIEKVRQKVVDELEITDELSSYFLIKGSETTKTYNEKKENILVLSKQGETKHISDSADFFIKIETDEKYYICYPKLPRKN